MPHLLLFTQAWFSRLHCLILTGLLLTIGVRAQAQAPTWQRAIGLGGATPPLIRATAADAQGNVFVVGSFYETATFSDIALTSAGLEDVFVAKWSSSHNRFVWAQRSGGTERDIALAVAVQGAAVYVAGSCVSPKATFGAIQLQNGGITGNTQAYVAKLTDAGSESQFEWVQAVGEGQGTCTALAIQDERVYVAGSYDGPLHIGHVTLANAATPGYGTTDIFIAKLEDRGAQPQIGWALRAGGSRDEQVSALVVNGTSVYLAGSFASPTAAFGATTLAKQAPTYNTTDAFVAKLTDAGTTATFNWAQAAGGLFHDYASGLAVQGTSLYVAGSFGSSATLGSITVPNAGTMDVFVAKMQDEGTQGRFIWARSAGGLGYDEARALAVRGNHLYVAGEFTSEKARFGEHQLTNKVHANVFVTRLTDEGSTARFDWAQQASGSARAEIYALALSGSQVFVGGFIGSPAQFGTLALASRGTPYVAFLASLNDSPTLGTRSENASTAVSIYPNPAHGQVRVHVPAVPGAAQADVSLLDAAGRVVRTFTMGLVLANGEESLPLTGLPAGLYQLRIQAGASIWRRPLVVN